MTETRLVVSALALEAGRPSGARERMTRLLAAASEHCEVRVISADIWTEEERLRLAHCSLVCVPVPGRGVVWRWRNERRILGAAGAFARGVILLQDAMPWCRHARLIGTVHDLRHWQSGLAGVLRRSGARHSLARAALITCPTESVRAELAAREPLLAARLRFVPNGVDTPPTPLIRSAGTPRILWIGHCEARKDPETMLRVFAELSMRWPDLRLEMVGRGELDLAALARSALGADAFPRFAWHQDCSASALSLLREEATLAVVTSRLEGFSMVPLECQAAGLPVVVSDLPAHREVLGTAARFAPAGDVRAFTAQIEGLLRDEGLRAQSAAVGRQSAARWSWDVATQRFLALLRELQTSE